ncbi:MULTISPECIES: MarR family transcriptional regulator [unclassified Modicisalibacter]|uniref:MarR family winged helix-turn-helix transcriptional regulator n=1 Tax=unclassified Modicisalibacter TaxID=2679913 RepID=UPI001CCFA2DB|nr:MULTISPECIES: MarR family transcriptional regulator [unclassified Modicisalibacter]MBZ9559286.1 MarR family transcriptional regulator [Modicisalibacter sp. R2A 31.J]MBZ9576549.1 MarR family transcriptional regulator [Modicisalibacter sp. MOD 31.J]
MAEWHDDRLRLANQVCFPLYAATNLLQRLYRPLLEPLGLTYSQYLVMLMLWEREPVTVGDIGACLHLDNGTLTPLLKRMERGGFITRRRDPRDERRVLIAPTPHGKALRAQAAKIPEELARRLELAPDEIRTLRSSVVSLVDRLADDITRGKKGAGDSTPPSQHSHQ